MKAVLASISLKDAKVDTTKLAKAIYGLEGTADIILVDGAAGLGKEPPISNKISRGSNNSNKSRNAGNN